MERLDPQVYSGATSGSATSTDAVLTARVRFFAACILALAGLIAAVYGRRAMQSDGISYLDMGEAILRGDWKMAVNGHWSPLYPWLQGLALRLLRPSAYWEFTVVHLVNFLIYLFALVGFDYLLRAVVADRPRIVDRGDRTSRLPKWAAFAVGYSVFAWSSLTLITLERVSPDLLLAGFIYLAAGLLLRCWAQPQRYSLFVRLGAVLAFAYLAKAAGLPLAVLFLMLSWILVSDWRKAAPRVLVAVVVFIAIAGPWIAALSRAKGRFTFGDSARFTYLTEVNHASPSWYVQNLGDATGHLAHPARRINDSPPIYEFASPVKGTIPIWYDPSYWCEGAVPRVILKEQLSVVHRWLAVYFDMIFDSQAGLLVGFLVLCFMGGTSLFLKQMRALWPIWVIGLAGLGIYALVVVAPRYVAVFFALLWVGLYSRLTVPSSREAQRLVSLVVIAVVIATATPVAVSTAGRMIQAIKGQPHAEWQAAEDLRTLGVKPGDQVARIGGRFSVDWARLLRVTVVAEVPRPDAKEFWWGTPNVQANVIETFRNLGVTAIIAEQTPPDPLFVPGPEWYRLGDGTLYALRLTADGTK